MVKFLSVCLSVAGIQSDKAMAREAISASDGLLKRRALFR